MNGKDGQEGTKKPIVIIYPLVPVMLSLHSGLTASKFGEVSEFEEC